MIAKVLIDRCNKAVRVEVEKVIDAGWLGYKFAVRHYALAVDQGWSIVCEPPGGLPLPRKGEEHFLETFESEPYTGTTHWVDAFAGWIMNPPRHPCCPRCPCNTEQSPSTGKAT